jgi:hypothetical protein
MFVCIPNASLVMPTLVNNIMALIWTQARATILEQDQKTYMERRDKKRKIERE